MKTILLWIIRIPFFIIRSIVKLVMFILKNIFGFLFGWIPDLNDNMSGEEFEEYVQAILMRIGYKNVELTKRSGDYGVDITARYKNCTYAIQCKLYSKPVGVAAVQQAYAGAKYYQCDQSVVVTNQRFTTQATTLAETNKVELWDGEYLNHLKRKANSRALFHKYQKKDVQTHPYQIILELILQEGYACNILLQERLGYSQQKAFYILDDLEFHDLVSHEDHLGIRDLYFESIEEAVEKLTHL